MAHSNVKRGVVVVGAALLSMAVQANEGGETAILDEVQSCISAVNSEIDTSGANRVQHVVEDIELVKLGYRVEIDTTVIGEAGEVRYATDCSANRSFKPYRLKVSEVQG